MVYRARTELPRGTDQTPASAKGKRKHTTERRIRSFEHGGCVCVEGGDDVPDGRSSEEHRVPRTTQPIPLRRRAYIRDIVEHPLLHSHLDDTDDQTANQLNYVRAQTANESGRNDPSRQRKKNMSVSPIYISRKRNANMCARKTHRGKSREGVS